MKTLLEITNAINNNLSTDELLHRFHDTVMNRLLIPRAVLFVKIEGEWSCPVQYGVDQDYSRFDVVQELSEVRNMQIIPNQEHTVFKGIDLVIPVHKDDRPLAYLLVGDIDEEELKMSPVIKHMRFVQTLANIVVVAIENKFLFKQSLERERVNAELELAAQMQALMVGSGSRDYGGFEVASHYKPHHEVGGDFCDFIHFNEDECFMCVADVSGKGVSAAFLMANVQAHLRALLEYTQWTLEKIVIELNKKVMETVQGERFVTFFMGYFHRPSRTLHYINAGHNPPVLWNRGKTSLLEKGTVGIGMLDSLPFLHKGEVQLAPNATLACYTDGVVELENEENEEFGYDRMEEVMQAHCPSLHHVNDLVIGINEAIEAHRGQSAYLDDTALLCVRFK